MTERYTLTEVISSISEKFDFRGNSIGWFIRLEGSGESFFISDTQPALAPGDSLKITLEKVNV